MNTVCGRCFLSYLRFNQKFYTALPGLVTSTRWFSSTKPVILQQIVENVKPFGKLVVNVPYDVEVKPTNQDEHSSANTLLVKVLSKKEAKPLDGQFLSVEVKDDICEIRSLQGQMNPLSDDAKCLIESPIQYDVDVQTNGDHSVDVSGMVSKLITIQTEAGNITGGKLQGNQIILSSTEGGSVKLQDTLQGNIEINTAKDGLIQADRLMGTELKVSTENGNVTIGSIYCTNSSFTTENGNLTLNNLHMDSVVNISGNGTLNIPCLDGSIDAKLNNGLATVHVVRLSKDSFITSNGDIHVIVPELNIVQLKLQAYRLDIDNNINGMEEFSRNMQRFRTLRGDLILDIVTSKSIKASRANWITSFNLGKFT